MARGLAPGALFQRMLLLARMSRSIGENCRIGAHVAVSHSLIGNRVTLYPGVRIGQDGFGFAVGPAGFETVPQLGLVIIEDDVEVGANSTIDRSKQTPRAAVRQQEKHDVR